MTIKLLNKHLTSFLTEPFAENFINAFKYNKRVKRLGRKSLNEEVANVVSKDVSLTSTIKNSTTVPATEVVAEGKLSNSLNLQSFKHNKVPSDYLYGSKSSQTPPRKWPQRNHFRGELRNDSRRSGETGSTGQMLYFIKGESLSIGMKKAESQIIGQFFENKLSTSVLDTKSTQGKTERQASTPFLHPQKNTFDLSNTFTNPRSEGPQRQLNHGSGSVAQVPLWGGSNRHGNGTVVGLRDSFSRTSVVQAPLRGIAPHFLFSLDQIRSEKVEQARFTSSKRIQNKNDSEFKKQLRECKKIRLLYGNISKRDLKKSLAKVQRLQGLPSENLLLYLETRLDVILERCGFFPTIRAARQSILHGRIQVNFKVSKVPSYQLKAGNIIKVNLSKSNCVKIHSYPKIQTRTTSLNPNDLSGVIQLNAARMNNDQQHFNVDQLDLNSVPTKFKKDILNFSRSFKKTTFGADHLLSFFIRFLQTHLYFQSIFSLLSFSKNKNNFKLKINVEETPQRNHFRGGLRNDSRGNTDKSISSVVPFTSNWRFSIPPYALSSILEIQSMLYEKSVINVFHYWVEIKKKLLYPRSDFWGETYSVKSNSILPSESGVNEINPLSEVESSIDEPSIQTSLSKKKKEKANTLYPSIQTNYLQKESKPLHLEVSYSSLCAIFLFPPQQIYFPATVDLDLITKLTGVRSK